ncbi:MAG: hypothetical protein GY830_09640 [Bacteroidetes bacterium]|nr:hypothetical protein [Bacteroidota bacterium]
MKFYRISILNLLIIVFTNNCGSPVIDTNSRKTDRQIIDEASDDVKKELQDLDSLDPNDLSKYIADLYRDAKGKIKSKTSIIETLEEDQKKSNDKNFKFKNFYSDLKRAIKGSPRNYEANQFMKMMEEDKSDRYNIPKKIKEDLVTPFYEDLKKKNSNKNKNLISRLKEYEMFKDIDQIKNEENLDKKDDWIEKHIKNEKKLTDLDDFIDIYENILPTDYKKSSLKLLTHIKKIRDLKKQKSHFVKSLEKIKGLDTKKTDNLFDLLTNEFFNDNPEELFEDVEIKTKQDFIQNIIVKIKLKIKRHNLDESIQKLKKIQIKIPSYFNDLKDEINKILDWNEQLKELNKLPNVYFDKFLPKDKEYILYQFTLYAQNISTKNDIEKVIGLVKKMEFKDSNFKKELSKILNEERTYLIEKEKIIKKIPEYTKPGGIPNQSNTCYAASLFQIISCSYPEPFYLYDIDLKKKKRLLEYLEKVSYAKGIKDLKDEIAENEKGKDTITKCKNLINNVRQGKKSHNIREIIDSLISIGLFKGTGGRQEDSQEFLEAILKILPSNELLGEKILQFNSDEIKYLNYDKYRLLLLPFPYPNDYNEISFDKLMKENFNENRSSALDKVINNLNKVIEFKINTVLNSKIIPKKLFIYLPRKLPEGIKNESNVKISLDLIIKKEFTYNNDKDIKYRLLSFNVHSGGAGGGHYYAYVKGKKDWYYISDGEEEQKIDKGDIPSKMGQGYLYCYERVD